MVPEWLSTATYDEQIASASRSDVLAALHAKHPEAREFAKLISPAATALLEPMAQRARALTRGHFGKTISLYMPLYLSNYCPGGCSYCGFASDRKQARHKLTTGEMIKEIGALKNKGVEDVLLLTGERCPQADFSYLLECVSEASRRLHRVTVEAFSMTQEEYSQLEEAGCTGITLYQETYDPVVYEQLHRWGEKKDFAYRLDAPGRALEAGMRSVGIGALFGLADPVKDALSVFLHARQLQREHWRSGVMISFPRICHEVGDFSPAYQVTDQQLVQFILAFRICLPDVPLVLSTRESQSFRDGMAGIGISRMSVASRTTVGGYGEVAAEDSGQFDVQDTRDVVSFCAAMRSRGLEPVFKNWDAVFQA